MHGALFSGEERNKNNEASESSKHCQNTRGIIAASNLDLTRLKNFLDIDIDFNSQVIGTKTKIYMVMDYVSGGQLSDKMVRFN